VKAAVLHEYAAPPRVGEFDDPVGGAGEAVVDVTAAGVNHLDLLKASGTFYTGPPPLPSVVGSDGVGVLKGGRRVYFDTTVAPFGAMAERTLVPDAVLLDVADGTDDAVAAALGNCGLAAWLSLSWRAKLEPGESVLILGATGAVGGVAVQAAKLLGAGRVVAAGRSGPRLERVRELGADEIVDMTEAADLTAAFREAAGGGVDVVIDMLWGDAAVAALGAAAYMARHVQVGHIAGPTITLPAPVVRSAPLAVMGYANFHVPIETRRRTYLRITELAARGELTIDLDRVALDDVATAWERQQRGPGAKLVVVP